MFLVDHFGSVPHTITGHCRVSAAGVLGYNCITAQSCDVFVDTYTPASLRNPLFNVYRIGDTFIILYLFLELKLCINTSTLPSHFLDSEF